MYKSFKASITLDVVLQALSIMKQQRDKLIEIMHSPSPHSKFSALTRDEQQTSNDQINVLHHSWQMIISESPNIIIHLNKWSFTMNKFYRKRPWQHPGFDMFMMNTWINTVEKLFLRLGILPPTDDDVYFTQKHVKYQIHYSNGDQFGKGGTNLIIINFKRGYGNELRKCFGRFICAKFMGIVPSDYRLFPYMQNFASIRNNYQREQFCEFQKH